MTTSPHVQSPLIYFALLLKASLVSSGGTGNLPSVRADFTARHWATEQEVVHALTIGQISPGPTGLWVVSFGYLTGGLLGSLLATAAIILPPLLVLLVKRLHARYGEAAAVQGFVHGIGLAAVGTFGCVLTQLLLRTGVNGFTLLVMLAACALGTARRLPSIAILATAAAAGILARF